MMGGVGNRFGAQLPKQYTIIDGRPLFIYIVERLARQPYLDGIVIVATPSFIEYVQNVVKESSACTKIIAVVSGGESRSVSVLNGLKALSSIATRDDVVLIHDATHPYVDESGTLKVAELASKYGAATLASLNYDTTYLMDDQNNVTQVIPRRNVIAGASPEGFRFGPIYDIYSNASSEIMEAMTSAGAIALSNNIPMKVVPTNVLNLKITYPGDMDLFLKLHKGYFFQ